MMELLTNQLAGQTHTKKDQVTGQISYPPGVVDKDKDNIKTQRQHIARSSALGQVS